MPYHWSLPLVGRAFTVVAAGIAAAGIANCAAYGPNSLGARDGTLGPSFSATPFVKASLHDIMAGASGTYMDRLLADRDSTIERWPDHVTRPLRIWIDSTPAIGGAQAGFPAAVRGAIRQWTSTGIPLRFLYVSSPRDADVRIRWTDHLDHKTGSTTWRTDGVGWLVSGDITLATHISDGRVLDGRGMRAIALHEIGHALGMSHSDSPKDIMAPLVQTDSLSTADRNTIKYLYTLTAGRIPPSH